MSKLIINKYRKQNTAQLTDEKNDQNQTICSYTVKTGHLSTTNMQ